MKIVFIVPTNSPVTVKSRSPVCPVCPIPVRICYIIAILVLKIHELFSANRDYEQLSIQHYGYSKMLCSTAIFHSLSSKPRKQILYNFHTHPV